MIRRIKRIAPFQAGKILGILYGCMGLIFLPFFAIFALVSAFLPQAHANPGPPAAVMAGIFFGMAVFLPILYGIMGFIFGVLGAAVYNLIARWVGGFEVEVE
jgi:uncharacterized membrane protein (DUF485 family)